MSDPATPKEPARVRDSRDRRASRLAEAVLEWQRLAERRQYPRSLHDILEQALTREYALGARSATRPRGRQ